MQGWIENCPMKRNRRFGSLAAQQPHLVGMRGYCYLLKVPSREERPEVCLSLLTFFLASAGAVLLGFILSTWPRLESSGRGSFGWENASLDWPVGKAMAHFFGLMKGEWGPSSLHHSWAGGPGSCKKAVWMGHGEQGSKQHPATASCSLQRSSCPDFPLWPQSYRPSLPLPKLLLVMVFHHSNSNL